jgi:hypothetical protein
MFRLTYVSVNGGKYIAERRFATVEEIQQEVPRDLRGITCYWRVEIADGAGSTVMLGTRAGYNGTGNRWVWQET